jgi:hypothetical protein
LLIVLFFIEVRKPRKQEKTSVKGEAGEKQKIHLTVKTWGWAFFMLMFFIVIQIYNVGFSYIISEKGLGTASDAGLGVAFYTIAGMIMGLIYGRVSKVVKNYAIAIACLMVCFGYFCITFADNLYVCYLGSVMKGFAMSLALPSVFYNTGLSTDSFSASMAVSIVTCAQNFGQFVSPHIINPVAGKISAESSTQASFGLGIAIAAVLTVVMFVWATRKTLKEKTVQA